MFHDFDSSVLFTHIYQIFKKKNKQKNPRKTKHDPTFLKQKEMLNSFVQNSKHKITLAVHFVHLEKKRQLICLIISEAPGGLYYVAVFTLYLEV